MTGSRVAIIILAAGASSRMSIPKQLLPMRGRNLLRHTIDEALTSKAGNVYVVLGADATQIQNKLGKADFSIVMNPHWQEGMSSSIRAGLSVLPESVDAAIITLCDQPFLSTQVLDALIEAFTSSGKTIVASAFEGAVGPPVLFSRKHFPELMQLQGDTGARSVVLKHEADAARVPFPSGSVDLDTPEDYQQFIKKDLGM